MSINKTEVLTILRENDSYVSGKLLCDKYQVSRQAIWKVINQLKEEGYQIESIPNKGYRLLDSPDILSKAEIEGRLQTTCMGRNLYYYEETGSTNLDAKSLADKGEPHGTLVVADAQKNGRGRRGREWKSPAGFSCYFSLLLKPDFEPDKASRLTLVMAHSVALAIERLSGCEAQIKWPNDIVMQGKKVCGILTEMTLEADYIGNIVIGVGININQDGVECFPEEVRAHAGSIRMMCGKPLNRAQLVAYCMEQFEKDYEIFLQTLDLQGLQKTYEEHLINYEKQVRVLDPKGEYTGVAKGITPLGELLVEREDGSVTEVYSGEVSVRGIYGYV